MANIEQAARENDRRKTLEALRDKLANTLDNCDSGRDIAALSKRLMEVMEELEALPEPGAKKNPAQAARERVKKRGVT